MKNISVRVNILATFAIVFLVSFASATATYYRVATIEEHTASLASDSVVGVHQSSLVKDALAGAHIASATKGSMTADDQRNRATVQARIAAYEQTITTDDDRDAFAKFKSAYADYENAKSASNGEVTSAVAARFDVAYNTIAAIVDSNGRKVVATTHEIDGELQTLLTMLTVSSLFIFVVLIVSGRRLLTVIMPPLKELGRLMDTIRQGDFTQRMRIARDDELGDLGEGFNRMADEVMELVGQVQRSGIRVSTSMTEIAATSKQQQATATEVAATTTQIGATSREIAATSKELVRTMSELANIAEHAAGLASGGHGELAHMEDTMDKVMEAAGSINAKLAVLNEKASAINQVVTTITKVADQTNLLSLNAAIEAEKAGEYGRGFAVVSSEIRRLADQTAVATYDIEQMVRDIQSAVSASVMGMDKFSEEVRRGRHDVQEIGSKLSDVIGEVQALAPQFETVSEGMQAQATGAEQISEALVQLTDATQQTVESLRQSTTAIDELQQVSGNLHGSIARFRLAAA